MSFNQIPTVKMASIDNEIVALRKRIEELEEKKRLEALIPKPEPIEVLEKFIAYKKFRVENGSYKTNPIARCYDREKIQFLQPILDALQNINERLTALEPKA